MLFDHLDLLPADPILGLGLKFAEDTRPHKVGLTVGVYQDEKGDTPVLGVVKEVESDLVKAQRSKSYIAQAGEADFRKGVERLVLGEQAAAIQDGRCASIQTPGGCGALRIGAELINGARPGTRIWLSDPSWDNHLPLLTSAGLKASHYPYYDTATRTLDFDRMIQCLERVAADDVVLFHACCHNPTGADLNQEQWDVVAALAREKGFTPFIDIAYQGFSESLEADAYGLRRLVDAVPETIIAMSCSKNFGLYRERTGALLLVANNADATNRALSHGLSHARRSYTMAPYHGAGIVGMILNDPQRFTQWQTELDGLRVRMNAMREQLSQSLNERQDQIDFSFIAKQRGMFSFLGISQPHIQILRDEFAIYILDSSRINVAGLRPSNIDYVAESITTVLTR